MSNLKEKNWGVFFLDDLFDIKSSTYQIDKVNLKTNGTKKYPYVTRSNTSNGLSDFISNQEVEMNKGNVITIGLDTQTVFYQESDFYTGQNIQILECDILNKKIALFLIPILEKQMEKFNWGGNGATLTRLRRLSIVLPVDGKGKPDWTFMEQYIETKEENIKHLYRPNELHIITDHRQLSDLHWELFAIEEVGVVTSGADWEKYNRVHGVNPFIGSSAVNNGVTDFVDFSGRENKVSSGVIGINRNGSVGHAFYHPYKAYFSGDTRFVEIVGYKGNQYVNQFIITSILKQKDKYAYGYKMGTERIKKQKILLPVNDNGKPDYEFMEQYMKRQENRVISQIKQEEAGR